MSVEALARLLSGRRFVALTGAGCSTESGIPDYRGEGTRRRARSPVQYREFLRDAEARRRYWARSVIGWERFAHAPPNRAHHSLSALERGGPLLGIITQNVDRLHHAAGSRTVVELHGALERVRCLECGRTTPRAVVQQRLLAANPSFAERSGAQLPDGDAELPADVVAEFCVVGCGACGGVLKPDVVFFGESVPKPIVAEAYELLERASALLVVGSSLAVFSGYRFVRRAAERALPIGIINRGESRGDPHAAVRLDASAGEALSALASALAGAPVA